ncbi:hypothetical protein KSB_89110 [Ktedonobacter robiniae]|uniref:Luciferase-like domain-containing protein n=1 Tax=Ktedonobacter robiniae TaxID=2778365 RepID=A0ABQ3V652_9CHLR|nr:hypothetical protein KSB_89110 [Ktedonobacter robiniae]
MGFAVFQVTITERVTSDQEHHASATQRTEDAIFTPPPFQRLTGSIEQIIEDLVSCREQYGFSYIQIRDIDMEAFAPVVARLAGK